MVKAILILLLMLFIVSCETASIEQPETVLLETISLQDLPDVRVEKSKLEYSTGNSRWTLNGKEFSGTCESHHSNGNLKEEFGLLNGMKQNVSSVWYSDKRLKIESHYHQGKLHGEKKSWSAGEEHVLLAHLNYYKGKAHGEQKKWYATGELFKVMHLNMGREEGMQHAYRKNGDLFANYEAREGRTFGLKKAALCFGLEDEKVQYEIQ